jgi:hypothetical protein
LTIGNFFFTIVEINLKKQLIMENTLEFKGPFNIYNKESYKNHLVELNKPGVYIWGFMVDSKDNPINCQNKQIFDSKKMSFLPYYVGKKQDKIINRLNEHKDVTKSHAAKYTRLSKKHLKTFYKAPLFPIHFDNESSKKYLSKLLIYNLNNDNKAISYFNNPMFMFFLYQEKLKSNLNELFINRKPNNIPITLDIFKDCIKIDPLNDIVNNNFNFWFCYAEHSHNYANDNEIRTFYESLESLTYFSLKGKTISKVKSWEGDNKGYVIKDGTKTNIFKLEPSEDFPGY